MKSSAGVWVALLGSIACSPEATRVRDGGPGADPGNKVVVESAPANPQTRDTTLWPGRAPAPVERLARGEIPPPAGLSQAGPGGAPVTPDVAPTGAEQRTFNKGTSGDARRPQAPPPPPGPRD